ncbi:protein kinase domain-containing protein [Nocardia sp. NPDC055321]
MRLDPGAVFAGYTIERELGVGGMGRVYLAAHPRLERRIALKILNEDAARDAGVRARFDREAALVARLEHPHIVPIYDRSGPDDETPWICMKFVNGGDAATLTATARGGVRAEVALNLLTDAARALDYAHRHGILHRDVKPANILIDRSDDDADRAVLSDFGIARAFDDSLTVTHLVATLAYTAPERFNGDPADHRADIYSLGCTFYEILTGRKPFPHRDPAPVIAAHMHTPPPRPTDLRPDLPPALNNVIATALAKDPRNRYPTCTALATAARAVLNQAAHPTRVRRPGSPSLTEQSGPRPVPDPTPLPFSTEHDETLPYPSDPAAHTPMPGSPGGNAPPTAEHSANPASVPGRDPSRRTGQQPPGQAGYNEAGARAIIGRASSGPPTTGDPLPEALRGRLNDPRPEVREDAVHTLGSLLTTPPTAQASAARDALTAVAANDVPRVSAAARRELVLSESGSPRAGSAEQGPTTPNRERFVRICNWVAVIAVVLGGVLVLWSGGATFATYSYSGIGFPHPYDIGLVLTHGEFYVRALGIGALAAGAIACARRFVFGRRIGPEAGAAALAGFGLAALWGVVAFAELPAWMASSGSDLSVATGYRLLVGGQAAIVAGGAVAAVALLTGWRREFEFRSPRDGFGIASAALGGIGSVALLLAHAPIDERAALSPGYAWQFATAALFAAAVPIGAAFLLPRRISGAIVLGWAVGGALLAVFLVTQSLVVDTNTGALSIDTYMIAPTVFAVTLPVLAAVNFVAVRRAERRPATS